MTLAVTAGARRTASAFHRLEMATNAPSVQVELAQPDNPTQAQYADLPSAARLADEITQVQGVDGVAIASFMGATPDPDGSWFAVVVSEARGAICTGQPLHCHVMVVCTLLPM